MPTRFALISSLGSPFLSEGLPILHAKQLKPECLIVDGEISPRDREIFLSRLDPAFRLKNLHEIDLANLPVYFVGNHNSSQTIDLCQSLGIDYLVNFGTKRIVKTELIAAVKGILNSHPGILPHYRGCTAVEWSIFNGDPVGATVHMMSPGIDEGPILFTRTMSVSRFEDYETIRTRMVYHQLTCLVDGMVKVIENEAPLGSLKPQDSGTYYKPISLDCLMKAKLKIAAGEYCSE
jgi:methionyl-tRNA formyltransferase